MKNPVDIFFGWFAKKLEEKKREVNYQVELFPETEQELISKKTEEKITNPEIKKLDRKKSKKKEEPRRKKLKDGDIITIDPRDIRDIMELMGVPLVSLSKKRTTPIIYESPDGKTRIKISGHREHYIASIYDWDIIQCVAGKIQEIINSSKDIPPRTLIIPRHELLKELHKHNGKKEEKDLKASLSRLKLTGIETTILNEDGRYDAGFGFIDSWGYTDRKDIKEIRITLSQWLYHVICQKGSLLKVRPEYFRLTSGLKKFLYRIARKHVGNQNTSWDFLVETLYEKSGSEREFRKFKHDLKKAVLEDDIPAYFMKWVEENEKEYVRFISKKKEIEKMFSSHESTKLIQ